MWMGNAGNPPKNVDFLPQQGSESTPCTPGSTLQQSDTEYKTTTLPKGGKPSLELEMFLQQAPCTSLLYPQHNGFLQGFTAGLKNIIIIEKNDVCLCTDQTSRELCVPVFSAAEKKKKPPRRFNIYVMFYGSSIEKSNIISQLKSPAS